MFCGSGGVGKTSVAAAAALGARRPARRQGRSCSRSTRPGASRPRSASTASATAPTAVPPEMLKAAGVEPRGELWAAMLDTKQSWDDLVLRHAKDEETAYRILENRLYHNLTARFVQSHDYIAMERLYEIHAGGEYDLIVIDTPPTRNAIDFLEAPARMADFFGGRLLRWLTLAVPGRRQARQPRAQRREPALLPDGRPRSSGSKFLEDIAEFFLNFQSMYDGFVDARERGRSGCSTTGARRSRSSPRSRRRRCTRPSGSATSSSTGDFHLGALVLNKTLPDYLLDPAGATAATAFVDDAGPRSPTRVARRSRHPALDDPARDGAGAAHDR